MSSPQTEKVELILTEVVRWARNYADIYAISLVGSWARGTARIDSDIDLIVLSSNPSSFRKNKTWLDQIDWQRVVSPVKDWKDADYGLAWSRHVYLEDKTKIEFGFGCLEWASLNPIDAGTFRVVSNGCRILYEPEKLMTSLLVAVKVDGNR